MFAVRKGGKLRLLCLGHFFGSSITAVFGGCYREIFMTADKLTNALWSAAESERRLNLLLTQLDKLNARLPDEFNKNVVPLLDDLHALHCIVKALKYDLMHCVRKS